MQKEYNDIGIVFPGQGSQYVGMGKEIYESSSLAREVFDKAVQVLGTDLKSLCFNGPEDELTLTFNAQPAILTHSIAVYKELMERVKLTPAMFAGHSLGEYSALVAAGALRFEDALLLVRNRGLYMQSAVPPGAGAMAAIIGFDIGKIREIIESTKRDEVLEIANHNSPEQIVISGNAGAIDRCIEELKRAGAKRCIKLNVSAPFHCSLMKPAARKLSEDLKKVNFSVMHTPVVTNVGARIIIDSEEFRTVLAEQVVSPVQWVDCVRTMLNEGVKKFIEIGPGRVLSGLIKRLDKNLTVVNIEKPDDIAPALEVIG
jgi:[acyl-carrier-protein] S-malonyltransferase